MQLQLSSRPNLELTLGHERLVDMAALCVKWEVKASMLQWLIYRQVYDIIFQSGGWKHVIIVKKEPGMERYFLKR